MLLALIGSYGLVRAILSNGRRVPRLALICGLLPAAPMLVTLALEPDRSSMEPDILFLRLLFCSLAACLGLALHYLLRLRHD
ncbi:hypothetical protein D0B54_18505 [Solimonas sp. K1W22B-7]|nr:hypothetical protein D0B54_18505 [Solimonas sp. K1W22B-7]